MFTMMCFLVSSIAIPYTSVQPAFALVTLVTFSTSGLQLLCIGSWTQCSDLVSISEAPTLLLSLAEEPAARLAYPLGW